MLLFFIAVTALEWRSGAFQTEFAGHADEPAHYVTGLMLHDYILAGLPAHPMQFAEEYYLHYPKVALGHWPPFFYVVEAVWMLLFSTSRFSLLILMALFTTALAATVYRALRAEFGELAGIAGGLLLLSLPLVQNYTGMVMADVPVALFGLWAALAFGRYLDWGRWQDSARFALFASCAIMTKGNGLALALVPPLALLAAGRLAWLRRPSLWLSAAIVLAICVPWYALTLAMVRGTWFYQPGLAFTTEALSFYPLEAVKMTGVVLAAFAAVGIWAEIVVPLRRREPRGWAAGAGAVSLVEYGLGVGKLPSRDREEVPIVLPAAKPDVASRPGGGLQPAQGFSPASRATERVFNEAPYGLAGHPRPMEGRGAGPWPAAASQAARAKAGRGPAAALGAAPRSFDGAVAISKSPRQGPRGKWAATASWLLSVLLFQCLVPAGLETRFLVPAAAPLVLFAVAGFCWTVAKLPVMRWNGAAYGAAMACVLLLVTVGPAPKKVHRGFAEVAESVLARPDLRDAVFLVSSESDGEGVFISEIAMRERRPGHIVLRASKVLAQSDWTGRDYHARYHTPDDVMRFLDAVPVSVLVLDLTGGPDYLQHNRQLLALVRRYPNRFLPLGFYPPDRRFAPGAGIRVYEITGNAARSPGRIRIDMRSMLGGFIAN